MTTLQLFFFLTVCVLCAAKKNVLLIIVDDMRPEIGIYSRDSSNQYNCNIKTPNMDSLAKRSFVAKNAFVQQAICSPSRQSFLTGRRPETTRVIRRGQNYRDRAGNFTSLPQYFKERGYTTAGVGKIFHANNDEEIKKLAWTLPFYRPKPHYDRRNKKTRSRSWSGVKAEVREKNPLLDDIIAGRVIDHIKRFSAGSDPFMLVAGFIKPHISFTCPTKYIDWYPKYRVELPSNQYAPSGIPNIAWSTWGELRWKDDIKDTGCTGQMNDTLPKRKVKELRRAYYGCVSFIDSHVGSIMKALTDEGILNNTIVALIGDHGFLLGEHGAWQKHSNFGLATRAPLMISIPGVTDSGIVSEEIVEFVDLYPTLVEASGAGLLDLCPDDSKEVAECREGNSLLPLMKMDSSVKWKKAAFSWYPRGDKVMGYTMNTRGYRYSEWVEFNADKSSPNWKRNRGTELYDLTKDPEENHNVAKDPAYKFIRRTLKRQLRAGWRAALE